jgi:hypothetical protein
VLAVRRVGEWRCGEVAVAAAAIFTSSYPNDAGRAAPAV